MTRILWDAIGTRHFSAGVDRGVLFLQNGRGVPWNGLVAVNEAPSGADIVDNYIDGQKFFSSRKPEEFSATIEAFTYPIEFDEYDGRGRYVTSQRRKSFGFSYRTMIGNDTEGMERGYLIHVVYDALVLPSPRSHKTISDTSDLNLFSWSLTTASREISDRSGSHLIIDSTIAYPWAIKALEEILYGSASTESRIPDPQEILDLFEESAILKITDHGDGSWSADGPDDAILLHYTPWVETRRNLFRDPFARTISGTSWGSTAGVPTTITDPDSTTWARFIRAGTAAVRLADMKVGTSLLANTKYRFSFLMRSSYARTVSIAYRANVSSSGTAVPGRTIELPANVPVEIDYVVNTGPTAPTTSAGLTITQIASSIIGDSLDITEVNIELNSTATGNVLTGDDSSEDWKQTNWAGAVNNSHSIMESRIVSFEITWPSAVFLDPVTYRISSL